MDYQKIASYKITHLFNKNYQKGYCMYKKTAAKRAFLIKEMCNL